jgi:arginase family enzyme
VNDSLKGGELHHFLKQVKPAWVTFAGISGVNTLGEQVDFNDGSALWVTQMNCDVVIVGVPEVRNSIDNSTSDGAPALIRKWLYGMRNVSSPLRIADAGDVCGNTLNDRYEALFEVIKAFSQTGARVLVLGGSQDLSVPVVRALKKVKPEVEMALVDVTIDVDVTNTDFSSGAYLNRLLDGGDCSVEELTVMGCQYYYYGQDQEKFLKDRHLSLLRLKEMRSPNIDQTEVVLRDASFLSFDFRAIEQQQGWLPGAVSPNGINPVDACQIMWYAGSSDLMQVVGLFEVPASQVDFSQAGPLSAQMIWHFLEGMGARCGDYPLKSLEEYKYIVVPMDEYSENLHFFHNQANNRWWFEVPFNDSSKVVSCHQKDYENALNKELPPKWWRYFLKSKKNIELTKK